MEFYSNGKLFILGEYYVLQGAKVFALPTKFGQYLSVFPIQSKVLSWKSYDADGSVWYNDDIVIADVLSNNQTSTDKVRNTLIDILHQAHQANSTVLSNGGFVVETKLTFPRNWGLGTSSTLINNIAQWFQIDAFQLLDKSFGGSGFDIACAQHNTPVTYQKIDSKVIVQEVLFNPAFKENIYFVYLNQKRDSKDAIANFRKKQKNLTNEIVEVSKMTDDLLTITDLNHFINFFKKYESNLGGILEVPTIQEQLFPDFNGLVKSLGGWGGDFVMVASENDPTEYFKSKGYATIISYNDMIL
ncbi:MULTISPECIES: GYDIA family GHMP kinase [unclassified Flavobacterium]|uniref:GYDIA family GHMP kinase n=1 Tax=unclassified Flavobacterium TaxID=196869 RepID=UPI001C70B479|nr:MULTISPECIES: GYDIA family GHMP kinase [unclassified Flavobacterium]